MNGQVEWKNIRVWYTRKGPVRYISHLDINRAMQRALARSRLPIWHTQGYNPHLYLTFAMPTPLGYESLCETMDFRLVEDVPEEQVCQRLNACLPDGLRVVRAAVPVMDAEQIVRADYAVVVSSPEKTADELLVRLQAFFAGEKMLARKKTKKGEKELDLKPLIQILKLETAQDATLHGILRLSAGPGQNVSPSLVFEAFSEATHVLLDCVRVCKLQVYAFGAEQEEIFV